MKRIVIFFVIALPLLFLSAPSSAQTYVERPLTTPSGGLELLVGPVPKPLIDDQGFSLRNRAGDDEPADTRLQAGFSLGLSDDFELGVVPLRLQFFEDLDNPIVWGTYRLVSGSAEVGVRATIPLPIFDSGFWTQLAFPVVVRPSRVFRLETGGAIVFIFQDRVFADVFVPLRLAVNATPQIYVGLDTGLDLPIRADDRLRAPLGVFVGYTLAGPVDLALSFRWPDFFSPGDDETFHTEVYRLALGVNALFRF